MKKHLLNNKQLVVILMLFTGIAILFSSCAGKSGDGQMNQMDTIGLAAFQQAKLEAAMQSDAKPVATKTVVYKTTPAAAPIAGNMESVDQNDAMAPAKKGWSKAAKGAVIGAGAGAVAGAIINKRNRAVGAAIGGAVGAGGGYVIGRKMDKNDGRY